jgi:4-oxalocrotonate tautomerase family enzyme
MPLVKIELREGKKKSTLIKIRDTVMDSVVDALQLPTDDRNIRIIEYCEEFFRMKPPYEILIEIYMFSGRTKETKRKLFHSLVHSLQAKTGIEKEKIFILLNEQPLENWGIQGGLPADDKAFNFNPIS